MANSSLRKSILIILFFVAVIPVIFSIALLLIGWSEQSIRFKAIEDESKNQAKYILALQLRHIEQLGDMIGQSNELSSFVYSSENLKGFSENLVETKILNELQKLNMITGISVFDNQGKKILLVGNSKESALPQLSGFTLSPSNNLLQYRRHLKFDDQYLAGPSSRVKGSLVFDISVDKLIHSITPIKKLIAISPKASIDEIEIEVNSSQITKTSIVQTLIGMLSILIFGLIIGIILIQKKLVRPIVDLINYVRSQAGLVAGATGKDEILELKETFNLYQQLIEDSHHKLLLKSKSETLISVARQVAHDIRSPLSALTMLLDTFNSVPEEKRLIIRGAIQRINDIANDLLQKSKEKGAESQIIIPSHQKITSNEIEPEYIAQKTQIELIPSVVDLIISEKRIQYRDKMNIEIISDFSNSYGDFAAINANELKRVLSNLINNSVEAFSDQNGKVMVSIQSDKTTVSVIVRDNGKGIPAAILANLGEKGVTHGKETLATAGSGLGIYHAKQCIESFSGQFEIISKVGIGTTITMTLPKAQTPDWFVEKLILKTSSQVISLDDDLSIHQIWKGRLQSINAENAGISLLSFTSGNEFKNFVQTQITKTTASSQKVFLIDYELLNQNMTGLDLIEELSLGSSTISNAILVTSRYEEEHIRTRCAKLGVKLIPKGMAGFVSIEIAAPKKKYDAILIDDDDLIHMTWQIVAKEKGKNIKLLKTEAEFLTIATDVDLSTSIYVDVNLAQNVNGIEVAKRIHAQGFSKVYLATGYTEIEKPEFIEAIVGKNPQV
ncbi:MAG: HAMP domain-containing sensor histidine kinase [Bdellovibrionota bacterium]